MTNHTLGAAFNDVIESIVVLNDTAYLVLKDGRQVGLIGKPVTYAWARAQHTKPSIDWNAVAPEWKWLATDQNGRSYLYINKPNLFTPMGWWTSDQQVEASAFSSFVAGDCEWTESLVERPEHV